MPHVTLPLLFEELTGGNRRVAVEGETVEAIVAALDALYPGIGRKMLSDGKLAPIVSVTVDGKIAARGLQTPVGASSEVVVYPSFGGG